MVYLPSCELLIFLTTLGKINISHKLPPFLPARFPNRLHSSSRGGTKLISRKLCYFHYFIRINDPALFSLKRDTVKS